MDVKTVGKSDNLLKLEIDADVGFVNLLRMQLWKRDNVSLSAFRRDHPYVGRPQLIVKVGKGSPSKALKDSCKEILEMAEDFQKSFLKAFNQ